MTAITLTPAETRRYLSGIGGRGRAATALLLLDTAAAIGFAGGLAGGVTAVADESGPLAPWLAMMLAAGLARAGCAALSIRTGAIAAYDVKHHLRHRIAGAALRQPIGRGDTGTLSAAAVDGVEALDGYVARFLPAR